MAQVVVGRKLDDIFMVMEYMEHDLKRLQESLKAPFSTPEARSCLGPLPPQTLPRASTLHRASARLAPCMHVAAHACIGNGRGRMRMVVHVTAYARYLPAYEKLQESGLHM
jgi:hypothetical protein